MAGSTSVTMGFSFNKKAKAVFDSAALQTTAKYAICLSRLPHIFANIDLCK